MRKILPVDFLTSTKNDYAFDEHYFNTSQRWGIVNNIYSYFKDLEEIKSNNKIPKIIHQIWLGSSFPKSYKKWQASWKNFHPDWEYILWTDESVKSIDLELEEVFIKSKNFGVKSDILRYEILKKFGGVYADTDFECFKSFEPLNNSFDLYAGIMNGSNVNLSNGLIGSIPNHPIIKAMILKIENPIKGNKTSEILNYTGPGAFTEAFFENYNKSELANIALPVTFFFPFPNNKLHIQNSKKIKKYLREESYALHYWEVSWTRTNQLKKITSKIFRIVPPDLKKRIKRAIKVY